MKRTALLIGNTGGLEGVGVDVEKTKKFLLSPFGGGWYESEIKIALNPTKTQILNDIAILKAQKPDFAFVLFSGHGAQSLHTILELNSAGETIYETQLHNIASRQITIADCCRMLTNIEARAALTESITKSFGEPSNVRARYESRISQAIPQQVQLYACGVNQQSYDSAKGAIYLGHLLNSAVNIEAQSAFKTIELAHSEARYMTIVDPKAKNQTPEANLPKCISSQQLIISMAP
jgi:hypothetical protein